jgi:probable HAF family extracellular repeat protein
VFIDNQDQWYLWDEGDLTLLPSNTASVSDINDAGWIVGMAFFGGSPNTFLWNEEGVISPGGLRVGGALGVNDAGQVVGWVHADEIDQAFLWERGELFFLNDLIAADSGWRIVSADDINQRGEIAATGIYQGQERAVLLRPVPEPTCGLLIVTFSLMARTRDRFHATTRKTGS